jgi:hypothetical protein
VTLRERRLRWIAGLVLLALAIAAFRDLGRLGPALPWRTMDEFADFYCAGWALDRRASPYTYEPLRTCEHRVNAGDTFRGRLFRQNPAVAVPAPQPAYDFIPFMALGSVPVGAARVVDALAILIAVASCAAALWGLGVPLGLGVAALALSTAYVELNTGQIVPFALLALVLCGLGLARGRDALAGIAAALTAIEPTVGLPVILATVLFVPRARWSVTLTALALALASVGLLGWHGVARYVTEVLPAHSASELRFPFQYSLTYGASYLGASPAVARLAGVVSYIVLLWIGLSIAPRTAATLRARELLVFVPALSAVIAGPFLHQEELCFALPATLVIACVTRGTFRSVAAIALCVLSVPWIPAWGMKQLFLASIVVCAAILASLRIGRWLALATVTVLAATLYAFELRPPHLPVPVRSPSVYAADDLVQREWRDYTDRRASRDVGWFAIKIPTWAALIAVLAIAAALKPRPRGASESSPESSRETPHLPTAWRYARTGSNAARS